MNQLDRDLFLRSVILETYEKCDKRRTSNFWSFVPAVAPHCTSSHSLIEQQDRIALIKLLCLNKCDINYVPSGRKHVLTEIVNHCIFIYEQEQIEKECAFLKFLIDQKADVSHEQNKDLVFCVTGNYALQKFLIHQGFKIRDSFLFDWMQHLEDIPCLLEERDRFIEFTQFILTLI